MNKKHISFAFLSFPAAFIFVIAVVANMEINQNINQSSNKYRHDKAFITDNITIKKVNREQVLDNFFLKYNSPLIKHTDTFVQVADKYNIDFRLLPAISCMESGCGKKLIPNSYNPFGWGIYGNNVIYFKSYDEAIEKVGEGLNKNYFAKGLNTPEKIAPIYTPSKYSHWLSGVNFFISEINKSQYQNNKSEKNDLY